MGQTVRPGMKCHKESRASNVVNELRQRRRADRVHEGELLTTGKLATKPARRRTATVCAVHAAGTQSPEATGRKARGEASLDGSASALQCGACFEDAVRLPSSPDSSLFPCG